MGIMENAIGIPAGISLKSEQKNAPTAEDILPQSGTYTNFFLLKKAYCSICAVYKR